MSIKVHFITNKKFKMFLLIFLNIICTFNNLNSIILIYPFYHVKEYRGNRGRLIDCQKVYNLINICQKILFYTVNC